MKKVAISILAVAFVVVLFGCGGGGGGGGADDIGGKSATVIGNIYNTPQPMAFLSRAYAADEPGRIAAVSRGQFIEISTVITNQSAAPLDIVFFEVGIEDATALTKEYWTCKECYAADASTQFCNGIWTVEGGALGHEIENPVLPACNEANHATSGCCVDSFPEGIDCGKSTHKVDHEPSGDGYFRGNGNIQNISANTSHESTTRYNHPEIDIRPDHKAYWEIRDTKGNLLDRKDYLIDVLP